MKYQVKINSINTVEETNHYWSAEDYIALLAKFNFPDAEMASIATLRELLFMAITDFEPNDAAAIVLEYKLSDKLNEGQIAQISNDMLLDKISEEYPDISLHATLFHVNQLLFKAFNGKFPNTKATLIDCNITPPDENSEAPFIKEKMLKLLSAGLSENNLIKRLFGEQLARGKAFSEAESILWEVNAIDNEHYTIFTSDYWLSKEDLISDDFEADYEPVSIVVSE